MPKYLKFSDLDPDRVPITVADVKIETDLRVIKLLRHDDPTDKTKVTGRIVKNYADLFLTVVRSDRKKIRRHFTLHVCKGQCRVIYQDYPKGDRDRSVLLIAFLRDMEKAYADRAKKIVTELIKCLVSDPESARIVAGRELSGIELAL